MKNIILRSVKGAICLVFLGILTLILAAFILFPLNLYLDNEDFRYLFIYLVHLHFFGYIFWRDCEQI